MTLVSATYWSWRSRIRSYMYMYMYNDLSCCHRRCWPTCRPCTRSTTVQPAWNTLERGHTTPRVYLSKVQAWAHTSTCISKRAWKLNVIKNKTGYVAAWLDACARWLQAWRRQVTAYSRVCSSTPSKSRLSVASTTSSRERLRKKSTCAISRTDRYGCFYQSCKGIFTCTCTSKMYLARQKLCNYELH